MKTKKFNRKLALYKQTIARLDHGELKAVNGGITLPTADPADKRCIVTVITCIVSQCDTCYTCEGPGCT